jgi:hypothetical protein
MFSDIWAFVQEAGNRAMLGWIGSGIVVVFGGIWIIFQLFPSEEKPKEQAAQIVSASYGGVAIGGRIHDSNVMETSVYIGCSMHWGLHFLRERLARSVITAFMLSDSAKNGLLENESPEREALSKSIERFFATR